MNLPGELEAIQAWVNNQPQTVQRRVETCRSAIRDLHQELIREHGQQVVAAAKAMAYISDAMDGEGWGE